ncbi:MAG: phosphodiester glycosidase family protein, partial [Clostridia bacterium]|nr:phosphodiester glycosidase family protein [Clostridia bacterium]
MNADFFDMFGDCHPSGLCVKNGRVVANANSPRPFIGIKKDGAPVITDTAESNGIVNELSHAAAGLQMIVKDGKLYDFAPLEPFGYVRHPRTAAGVTKDGKVLLLAVDGRIPEYSNGASLVDLANIMLDLGADRAINLDGGGSTIVYTKRDGAFTLHNCPADLIRPRAMLIRKEFNALLVTA